MIKKQFLLYLIFLKVFFETLPCLISGGKELDGSMVEFLWFIQTGITLSENEIHQAP